jgi:hypothetical protein
MVLLASSFDQSKYLNANDLTQEKAFRIKSVTAEIVGRGATQETKPVLWFTNHKKGFVLNITNNRTLRAAFGDNMEIWSGKVIIVYPTQVDFAGKLVPALRVRIPPPKQAVAGNGQPSKIKVVQEVPKQEVPEQEILPPEPKPSLQDDLDDEIGF